MYPLRGAVIITRDLFLNTLFQTILLDLVNKANLVHSFCWYVYFFFFSTGFGRLYVHHQEKQLYLFDIVARNIERREINILRKIVHQVRFIYKIIQGCTVNKT